MGNVAFVKLQVIGIRNAKQTDLGDMDMHAKPRRKTETLLVGRRNCNTSRLAGNQTRR
jgi:hypothetical protein